MLFTEAQQSAISARNPELLVSAAAGSGKTAVLIERIYDMIAHQGYRVDRMLVVTFTNAAAAEMRERLEVRLGEAAEQSEGMRSQADLVEAAHISTLHSFCQSLLREFFEVVGIDPLARLCDEMTQASLSRQAMEECLEECYYQAQTDPALRALVEKFTGQEIGDMILSLHRFLMALPHPFAWLHAHVHHNFSSADLREGPMAETLLGDCRVMLDGALGVWIKAAALAKSPDCREGYRNMVAADGQILHTLEAASQESLEALLAAVSTASFDRMPAHRLTEPAEIAVKEEISEARKRYQEQVKDMKKRLPADGLASISDLQTMAPALQGLAWAVENMHQRYSQGKRDRTLIDFHDLEHMALAILDHPELQKRIASRFDAIFVDEYQDISEIQEAILAALQPKELPDPSSSVPPFSCFYVGDVKQSIYRFRQADPTLFMGKQERFSFAPEAAQRKINLSQNFRSREAILAGVNRVFAHVMQPQVTEIAYDEGARLHPGRLSARDPKPELHLFTDKDLRAAEKPRTEASLIAREILRLKGTPLYDQDGKESGKLSYRDMVILLPTAKGKAGVVEQVLTEAGIPVYCEDAKGGLARPEIGQALAHLRLLDNLMDDLSLLAALRGPRYQLTEEALANIRLHLPEGKTSFLEALWATAAATPADALSRRCRGILEDLEQERFLQQSMPLDEYLWSFLGRSGMYGFYGAQPGGKLRQANLRMLCHQASEHMVHYGGDLHDFVKGLSSQAGVHDGKSPTILSPWEDVVRIMTIHKSKGLEFPVVFVMGLGENLLRRKEQGALSMHAKLGVALRYVNETVGTKRTTLLGSAIELRTRMEERAERARVLYVAMTRARDRLYLLGSAAALTKEQLEKRLTSGQSERIEGVGQDVALGEAFAVWEAKSALEWLWQTIKNTDEIRVSGMEEFSTDPLWEIESEPHLSTDSTFFPQKREDWSIVFHMDLDTASSTEKDPVQETGETRLEKNFPEQRLEALLQSTVPRSLLEMADRPSAPPPPALTPLKVGVTALCRALEMASITLPPLFEEEAESPETKRLPLPLLRTRRLSDLPRLPSYLRGTDAQTALARGVATHKALSLLSFPIIKPVFLTGREAARQPAFLAEALFDLEKEGMLTPEERALIHLPSLLHFFQSPLGARALEAEQVHREWGFNLRLPEVSESILQGVIDLCFLEENAWVLVDFKTDRVQDVHELEPLYQAQMKIYKMALEKSTPYPVGESILYSLSLGQACSLSV